MLKVKEMPTAVDAGLLRRLETVDTATIGHFRYRGFVDPALRPVIRDRRVAGTAVTAALPANDSAIFQHLLSMVRPGDFLVIDKLGDVTQACLGGVVAEAARVAGAVGIALDGVACDFEEIRRYDLPVWCRGETALTDKLLAIGGAINVPVSCGGVAVNPGDAVLADTGGVLVLPPDEVEETLEIAIPMEERSPSNLARVRAGEKIGDITGATQMVNAARRGKQGRSSRD